MRRYGFGFYDQLIRPYSIVCHFSCRLTSEMVPLEYANRTDIGLDKFETKSKGNFNFPFELF